MAYLDLYNPTTYTCKFEVKLSNPFNTRYYQKLRITGRNYGNSTANVSSYLENISANRNNRSRYINGTVDDGMSAGRRYTLYAYALAKNGVWYKAGSDSIRMDNGGSEDLRIISITPPDKLIADQTTSFEITVKNKGNLKSNDFMVKVFNQRGYTLDSVSVNSLRPGRSETLSLDVRINQPGGHKLEFVIDGKSDDTEIKYFTWNNKIDVSKLFLDFAMSELGYKEGKNNNTKFGRWYGANYNPWCAMFVSWCASQAGVMNSLVPKHKYTPYGAKWFKDRSKYKLNQNGYNPKEGDVVYFYSSSKARIGHVGIVVAYDRSNDTLYTIEGNSSDKVILRNYTNMRNNKYVNGFGLVGGNSFGTIPSSSSPGSNTPIN